MNHHSSSSCKKKKRKKIKKNEKLRCWKELDLINSSDQTFHFFELSLLPENVWRQRGLQRRVWFTKRTPTKTGSMAQNSFEKHHPLKVILIKKTEKQRKNQKQNKDFQRNAQNYHFFEKISFFECSSPNLRDNEQELLQHSPCPKDISDADSLPYPRGGFKRATMSAEFFVSKFMDHHSSSSWKKKKRKKIKKKWKIEVLKRTWFDQFLWPNIPFLRAFMPPWKRLETERVAEKSSIHQKDTNQNKGSDGTQISFEKHHPLKFLRVSELNAAINYFEIFCGSVQNALKSVWNLMGWIQTPNWFS